MYEYMHKYQYVITSSDDAIKSMYEHARVSICNNIK